MNELITHTQLSQHSVALTSHYGVELAWLTSHSEPLPYKISFLLSQTDNKKHHLLYNTKIHSLFSNISCFLPKQNIVLLKMLVKVELASSSPKNIVSGNPVMHTHKNMLYWLLTMPTIRTHLRTHPYYHAYPIPQTNNGNRKKFNKWSRSHFLYVFYVLLKPNLIFQLSVNMKLDLCCRTISNYLHSLLLTDS